MSCMGFMEMYEPGSSCSTLSYEWQLGINDEYLSTYWYDGACWTGKYWDHWQASLGLDPNIKSVRANCDGSSMSLTTFTDRGCEGEVYDEGKEVTIDGETCNEVFGATFKAYPPRTATDDICYGNMNIFQSDKCEEIHPEYQAGINYNYFQMFWTNQTCWNGTVVDNFRATAGDSMDPQLQSVSLKCLGEYIELHHYSSPDCTDGKYNVEYVDATGNYCNNVFGINYKGWSMDAGRGIINEDEDTLNMNYDYNKPEWGEVCFADMMMYTPGTGCRDPNSEYQMEIDRDENFY